jgi:hypothetical protein
MMKWMLPLLCLFSAAACAEDLTDECLHSMQKVYKFYYYEIQPKGDKPSEKMSDEDSARMQTVVSELKKECSPEVIVKMNGFLQQDNS